MHYELALRRNEFTTGRTGVGTVSRQAVCDSNTGALTTGTETLSNFQDLTLDNICRGCGRRD